MNNNLYDLIIIGAGPAGLAASIYASRYKLKNIVIGKVLGGELSLAHKVCNFPGFEEISGLDLANRWREQAEKLGATVLLKEVQKIELVASVAKRNFLGTVNSSDIMPRSSGTTSDSNRQLPSENLLGSRLFKIYLDDNEFYLAKAVIAATGSERRRLNIPGEKEYLGRGVSYCHICDGPFFKGKTIAVIGGSDAAVTGAVHLAAYASKVYLIYRGKELRAEPLWIEEWQGLEKHGKGQTIWNTNPTGITGDGTKVSGIKLDQPYQGKPVLPLEGVFVEIGSVPGTALVQVAGVKLDAFGHVVTDDTMATNIPGLFAAGDTIDKSAQFKQATWAIGQGTRAAASVFQYIKKESAPPIRGI